MPNILTPRALPRCVRPALLALIVAGAGSRQSSAQTRQIPSALQSVAYHWAPFVVREALRGVICQLTSLEVNQSVRFDFDNDADQTNNQFHATCGNTAGVDMTATVYYSAVETGTGSDNGYYYLGYYWYEPKDNGFYAGDNIGESGHEHDMEGVVLLVQKSPGSPYGTLLNVLTQAHGGLLPYGANNPGSGSGKSGNGTYNLGSVAYWNDNRESGHSRVVAISAAGTHATYEPEICDANTVHPPGIVSQAQSGGAYQVCVRNNNDLMVYQPLLESAPSLGLPGADQLSTGDEYGLFTYQLLELPQTDLWYTRTDLRYFNGEQLALPGGLYGNRFFASTADPGQANPPWAWNGNQSCHTIPLTDGDCYTFNSFAEDGTRNAELTRYFPVTPYGQILTDPATDFVARFAGLPNLAAAPPRYNPYIASPPDYNGSTPLSAYIDGPQMVTAGMSYTWSANITGGTGPYTIQWSGLFGGSGTSVSGSPSSSGSIYLDVWDAASHHVAVSVFVTVCDAPQLTC